MISLPGVDDISMDKGIYVFHCNSSFPGSDEDWFRFFWAAALMSFPSPVAPASDLMDHALSLANL